MNATVVTWGTIGLLIIAFVTWRTARSTGRAGNRIAQTQSDVSVMVGTIETLRGNLHDAQDESDRLREDLQEARREVGKLRDEVTVALLNVGTLSDHIRDHVSPEVPFPRLRRVSANGS